MLTDFNFDIVRSDGFQPFRSVSEQIGSQIGKPWIPMSSCQRVDRDGVLDLVIPWVQLNRSFFLNFGSVIGRFSLKPDSKRPE